MIGAQTRQRPMLELTISFSYKGMRYTKVFLQEPEPVWVLGISQSRVGLALLTCRLLQGGEVDKSRIRVEESVTKVPIEGMVIDPIPQNRIDALPGEGWTCEEEKKKEKG